MRFVAIKPAPTRWLVRSLLPLTIAFSCTTLVTMPALAQPPPSAEPTPTPGANSGAGPGCPDRRWTPRRGAQLAHSHSRHPC
jgi:hypothetical protein